MPWLRVELWQCYFRPIAMGSIRDAAYLLHMYSVVCLCVYVSVCESLLVTSVSAAKTVEPIQMPFGVWLRGAQKPRGCTDSLTGRGTVGVIC